MKIQPKAFLGRKREALFCACLAGLGMLLLPCRATAQINVVTLSNGGSTAVVNLGGGAGNIGMNDWDVGQGNELAQQWFWYQIGNGPVQSIDQLGNLSYTPGTDNGFDQDELSATYSSANLSITISYELQGAGPGTANIMEGIQLVGTGLGSTNVNLFQYSNFQLAGQPNTLQVYPDGSGGYLYAQQTVGATAIAEGIISPDASNAEASDAGTTLSAIEAGNLNGNSIEAGSPPSDPDSIVLTSGPGDEAWAFEWTAAGGNLDIAKQKQLSIQPVPEPSTLALIALGLGACGFIRRRQS